jgi:hypothetical protein
MAMVRGTNAEFRWKLPYDFSELTLVEITFWQDNNSGPSSSRPLPIIKVRSQCHRGDKPNELSVTLNQEETLRFTEKRKAKVQLRAKTTTGVPFASKVQLITVYPIYNDSVLDDTILPTPPSEDELILLDGQNII